MTSWFREYTIQSIFVALQATVIVYGILLTGTLLKINGYPEFENFAWHSRFVRHAGLILLLIPAGWVWLTIWYDRADRNYPLAFTVLTGVAVLFFLYRFLSVSAAATHRKTYSVFDDSYYQSPPIAQAEQAVLRADPTVGIFVLMILCSCVALAGGVVMSWAKLPLFRRGRIVTLGPGGLDDRRTNFYKIGLRLSVAGIIAGTVLVGILCLQG